MKNSFAFVVATSFMVLLFSSPFAEAATRCYSAKGKLVCKQNSNKAMDVEIFLMDDDGVLNNDDQMGWTTSNEDGTFKVEGCGYDLWSDPDPYLKIYNGCRAEKEIITRVDLPQTPAPEILDAGEITLDS